MERFAILGLGRFGGHVARTLFDAGKQVLALDAGDDAVERAAEYSTRAAVVDATDREALEALGLADMDAAIVSLGGRMDVITLAALHIREIGVPYIAVKALSEEHGRILKALGIHDVIHPEKDMAIRLGNRLARRDVVEFLPLLPGYSITEMRAPREFVGRSLKDLALRNNLNVQLVAIHRGTGEMNIVPRADDVIADGDLLVLLGDNRDLDRVRDIVRRK